MLGWFVRVDVGIMKEHQENWGVEDFHRALEILRNRMSNKDTCFHGLQGCIWAFEQGAKKGYHCHLLLIYDANLHWRDEWLGEQVGKYWQQYIAITKGAITTVTEKRIKKSLRSMVYLV